MQTKHCHAEIKRLPYSSRAFIKDREQTEAGHNSSSPSCPLEVQRILKKARSSKKNWL